VPFFAPFLTFALLPVRLPAKAYLVVFAHIDRFSNAVLSAVRRAILTNVMESLLPSIQAAYQPPQRNTLRLMSHIVRSKQNNQVGIIMVTDLYGKAYQDLHHALRHGLVDVLLPRKTTR
jgi:hypothetical protein